MQVEIKIDPSYTEPKIIVLTSSMTEDVSNLVKKLSENVPDIISGSRNEKMEVLEQADLIRVYANAGKVFAVTPKGEYLLRLRLYELEERLNPDRFVRISNSEIINLKKVKSFDLSITGTICVQLTNGTVTYVSRRYVSKLKKILGI
ncbi:MAG: LytTR family transcriptional regulator [Lachnospiraceae bacterium]|nr:LytTR family transcriptional regulator [Lachnospiraceae bacterium]